MVKSASFAKKYAVFGVLVLFATTLLWTILSANLQRGNADQLVNPYLLQNSATFHGAVFPGAHSLLIKWPLFWLVKYFGVSGSTLTAFTILTVLFTVGALAYILHRIERRPLIFGTLCLALASVLLLIPAQPYAGGLLPVNMAMIATRNLEYVLYIASLAILIHSPKIRSWKFWLAIVCLTALAASDKLFLIISLGGATVALILYALTNGWNLVSLSVRWLLGSAIAGLGAITLLWLLNVNHITHIASQSGLGSYGVIHSIHDFVLGSIYAVLGLFTNFGANPAYDATILRNVPHQTFSRLISAAGPAYVINAIILFGCIFVVFKVIARSLAYNRNTKSGLDNASRLAITLVWSSITAFGLFILSRHYYAVDARYLTISLFALFIGAATVLRRSHWRPEMIVVIGVVITAGILAALPAVVGSYKDSQAALSTLQQRDISISQAINHHHVDTLVGDYWRVMPTKLVSPRNSLSVTPLSSCAQPRNILSSYAWQPDLKKHSFAYLLTLDGSLTDYPSCTLDQVINYYGRPNSTTLIAGSLTNPKELLMFYDNGINMSAPTTVLKTPSTVLPITTDELPYTSCPVPTILNVVAHEDDDLLFMSPDIVHDVQAGHCIRTIYVTAGDAGGDQFFWLSREQGSEAAYSNMLGFNGIWIKRIVKLSDNEFITVANPRGNSKISLIFMHLPDGNLRGEGFKASHNESLARLEAGKISTAHTVDGQSSYTSSQLTAALASLMQLYHPAEINTQANFASSQFPDHSDHMAVGRYVKSAYTEYEAQQFENRVTIPIEFFIGYPAHQMPANVSGPDLAAKDAAWFDYAKFDGTVCQSPAECSKSPTYGSYLQRQYENAY